MISIRCAPEDADFDTAVRTGGDDEAEAEPGSVDGPITGGTDAGNKGGALPAGSLASPEGNSGSVCIRESKDYRDYVPLPLR